MRPARLFVYGTLRRGFENKFARLLQTHSRYLGRGRVHARIYQFPPYPGAVLSDRADESVHGELYQLSDPDIWHELDRYEGSELFRRVTATVRLDTGYSLDAWIYVLIREPESPLT